MTSRHAATESGIGSKGAVLFVAGARPNFMKIAPIVDAVNEDGRLAVSLVHTGQHYGPAMQETFFKQLGLPDPDVNLEVGSASHALQTAEVMRRFEPVLDAAKPAAVVVVGDVNSTLACALVAAKKGTPVLHVESGLRSFDRSMPEEINRLLTDQLADLLFTSEASARENLLREGIAEARIKFVGNVMIDSLHRHLPQAIPLSATMSRLSATTRFPEPPYAALTLHRPSNVDSPEVLGQLMSAVEQAGKRFPIVFPVHPRTRSAIGRAGLAGRLDRMENVYQLPPVGYLEMLGLMRDAQLVLTDSGGMQEETTALGVPCLTLRENTERPVTVEQGTNTLVGLSAERILAEVEDVATTGGKAGRIPELWDGCAARRIKDALVTWLESGVECERPQPTVANR